jgi:hypothetical protein
MPKKTAPAVKTGSALDGPSEAELFSLAQSALLEVTGEETFSTPPTLTHEEGVSSAHFPSAMPGYPGWSWTVALATIAGSAPTVLEVELVPGDSALLSPEWVPWADRMEEYLIQEKELKDALDTDSDVDDDVDDDDDDDDVDDDDDDVDDFVEDVDGVDIDQLDIGLEPALREVSGEATDEIDLTDMDDPDSPEPAER